MIRGIHKLTLETMLIAFDVSATFALVSISIDLYRDIKNSLKGENYEKTKA